MGNTHPSTTTVRTISAFLLTTVIFVLVNTTAVTAPLVQRVNLSIDVTPTYMTVYDGKLYFSANSGDGSGTVMWTSVDDSTSPQIPKKDVKVQGARQLTVTFSEEMQHDGAGLPMVV